MSSHLKDSLIPRWEDPATSDFKTRLNTDLTDLVTARLACFKGATQPIPATVNSAAESTN